MFRSVTLKDKLFQQQDEKWAVSDGSSQARAKWGNSAQLFLGLEVKSGSIFCGH